MNRYTWLAIIALIIGVFGIFLIVTAYSPQETQEIPVTFKVVDGGIGLLKEDRFLHFGHVTQGGGSNRKITIGHENDVRYRVYIKGPPKDYILVEPWQGNIDAGQQQNINLTLIVPKDLPLGEYNGTAHVEIFSR